MRGLWLRDGEIKMKTTAIEVNQLSFAFQKGKRVLNEMSFSLDVGEIMTILGQIGRAHV